MVAVPPVVPAQAGIQAIFGEPLRWRRLRQQQLRKHRLDPSFRWDDGVGALGPCGAYFGASTLRELAAQRPHSEADLEHISGIGARKREAYGPAFLELIAAY